MSLRKKLAEFGFESNDDYEFPVRCLFEARVDHVRCLNVTGDSGRRKTAFANALAQALDYPHILYHDFTQAEPVAGPIFISAQDSEHQEPLEAPLSLFERRVTEACAYSEGAGTVLILDQLQAADFREHIRLYQLAQTREWRTPQGTAIANPKNLLLILISEEPLYHSLAKISLRIHAGIDRAVLDFHPEEFGLPPIAADFMMALADVFRALGVGPTPSEYAHILDDSLHRVRTPEQLRQSLYGRMEYADYGVLAARELAALLEGASAAINQYVGEERIEIS